MDLFWEKSFALSFCIHAIHQQAILGYYDIFLLDSCAHVVEWQVY
jgi:hypothetical protein